MNIVQSKKPLLLFFLFFFGALSILFFTSLSNPVSADEAVIPYKEYSVNNIYFYKGCDRINRSSVTASTTASASGSTADEKIWSALKSLGLSDEIAAGILGNIHNEGSASPVRYEDAYKAHWADGSFDWENDTTKGHGVGIVQWSGDRRVKLFKHLRDKGAGDLVDKYLKHPETYGAMSGDQFIAAVDNPKDADTLYALEIDFLVDEVKNNSEYSGVLQTKTVAEAAEHFSMHFEQCGNGCKIKGSAENKERIDAAEQMYQQFAGKSSLGGVSYSSNITPCDCDDGGNLIGGGLYAGAKYSFSDEELKRLWWAATAEEGEAGEEGIKTELSLFANRFESKHVHKGTPGDNQGLINSVLSSDYASTTHEAYRTGGVSQWGDSYPEPSSEQISAAKSILNYGNRTLPVQVIEHDRLGDIKRVTNNNAEFDKNNRSEYKTGVTVIYNVYREEDPNDPPYVFFRWANGEQVCSSGNCGDPFGWKQGDEAPSQSTLANTETGSITWTDDGWIEGGIDGYTKESAAKIKNLDKTANKDFTTDMPNAKGKGPDKINISTTESSNGTGNSALELYKSNKTSRPPHFTIDLKNKKLYQHFPIYKTAATFNSNASDSAGIQIRIIGYSDEEQAKANHDEAWLLSSFTDSDLDYLTELIRGLSSVTGIDTNSVTGPDSILEHLKQATAQGAVSECGGGGYNATGDVKALQELVMRWAWPDHRGRGYVTKKPEYDEDIKQSKYTGDECYGGGVDCGGFVYSLVTLSGWDPDFPTGPTADNMLPGLRSSPKWEEVTSTIHSNSDAKPGDVIIKEGHVLIYVGKINGFGSEMASASQCDRAPMADRQEDITYYSNQDVYHVFRKVK